MGYFKKNLFLIICSSAFLVYSSFFLTNYHDWGGDFAQYIKHSLNILESKSYSEFISNKHFSIDFPYNRSPIFPLFITPIIYIFGVQFYLIKFVNIFSILIVAIFTSKIISLNSIGSSKLFGKLVFLYFLTAGHLLYFSQQILPDLLFTSLLVIFFFYNEIYLRNKKKLDLILLCLFFILLPLTKSNYGVLINIVYLTYLLLNKNYKIFLIFLGIFFISTLILINLDIYYKYLLNSHFQFSENLNIEVFIKNFFYVGQFLQVAIIDLEIYGNKYFYKFGIYCGFLILILLLIYFIKNFFNKKINLYDLTIVGVISAIFIFNLKASAGSKSLYPILPLLLIRLHDLKINKLRYLNFYKNIIFITLIIANIFTLDNFYKHFRYDELSNNLSNQAFNEIRKLKKLTEGKLIVGFFKPRVLGYLTDVYSERYFNRHDYKFKKNLNKYYLYSEYGYSINFKEIYKMRDKNSNVCLIWQNERYKLFEYKKVKCNSKNIIEFFK